MGYSLSWAAVRGKSPEAVRAELGLEPTGVTLEVPEGDFCSVALETGWFIVVSNLDERFVDDAVLAKLSAGCEVVGCFVEEHVMMSRAAGWREGQQQWSLTHQAEVSRDDLSREGTPPPVLAELEAAARSRRQAEPDGPDFLFDVPANVAQALSGFRHDEGERSFAELRLAAPPPKKSWLQKMLG